MKIWKITGIVSAAILIAAAVGLAVYHQNENAGVETGSQEQSEALEAVKGGKSPPEDNREELYERLHGFAQVLYEYDTDERRFYEGAEAYMTEEAFLQLRPQDAADDGGKGIRIRSWLISTDTYVHYNDEKNAEVIMESCFTLSQSANGSVMQYLKLSVEKIDGQWMITKCQVIDTLEE